MAMNRSPWTRDFDTPMHVVAQRPVARQQAERQESRAPLHEAQRDCLHGLASSQELPIRIPVRKTSTPPTTTWNAAESRGVSM
jgi:hypothetical protein